MNGILLRLYFEFFKIGLFSVGGGLATLPFLSEMGEKTGWFSSSDISNMIAVSESTPGPLGINMATFVGYTTAGPLGAVVAPLGLISPAIIIIIIIAGVLHRFKSSSMVQGAFYGLRPASMALIAAAGLSVAQLALLHWDKFAATGSLENLFFWKGIALAAVLFVLMKKLSWHPVIFIVVSGIVGVLLKF